jgi:hypothetical protein
MRKAGRLEIGDWRGKREEGSQKSEVRSQKSEQKVKIGKREIEK